MFRFIKQRIRSLALITTVISLLAQVAMSRAQTTSTAIISPCLTDAKTLQVTQKVYVPDGAGHRTLERILNIRIERPVKIRIEQAMLHDYSGGGEMPGSTLFILTDKTGYEYSKPLNQYVMSPAPSPGQNPYQLLTFAYNRAADLDLLRQGHYESLPEGTRETTHTDRIAGKRMQLSTVIFPSYKQADGSLRTVTVKRWTDIRTGLPYRVNLYVSVGAQTKQVNSIDFADWKTLARAAKTYRTRL